jgi:hypothetical protein
LGERGLESFLVEYISFASVYKAILHHAFASKAMRHHRPHSRRVQVCFVRNVFWERQCKSVSVHFALYAYVILWPAGLLAIARAWSWLGRGLALASRCVRDTEHFTVTPFAFTIQCRNMRGSESTWADRLSSRLFGASRASI